MTLPVYSVIIPRNSKTSGLHCGYVYTNMRMKVEEVQRFLWFCTGSSVCISTPMKVVFNGLSGLERRPIAHTCDCKLELPRTYSSFLDFATEFTAVLAHEDNGWKMDGI